MHNIVVSHLQRVRSTAYSCLDGTTFDTGSTHGDAECVAVLRRVLVALYGSSPSESTDEGVSCAYRVQGAAEDGERGEDNYCVGGPLGGRHRLLGNLISDCVILIGAGGDRGVGPLLGLRGFTQSSFRSYSYGTRVAFCTLESWQANRWAQGFRRGSRSDRVWGCDGWHQMA